MEYKSTQFKNSSLKLMHGLTMVLKTKLFIFKTMQLEFYQTELTYFGFVFIPVPKSFTGKKPSSNVIKIFKIIIHIAYCFSMIFPWGKNTYSRSSSKDLTEKRGEFGSFCWTFTSPLTLAKWSLIIFFINDLSSGLISLSSEAGGAVIKLFFLI